MATLVTDYTPLIALCHSRWVIPAIAELHSAKGLKLVTLANRLEVAQTTAKRALDRAITLGYARRNTGYGHPLRPEYLCTPQGITIAPRCITLVGAIEATGQKEACALKWSLPVLAVLARTPARFAQLRDALSITDRALAISLRTLVDEEIIERRVELNHPLAVSYNTRPNAVSLAFAAHKLAVDASSL